MRKAVCREVVALLVAATLLVGVGACSGSVDGTAMASSAPKASSTPKATPSSAAGAYYSSCAAARAAGAAPLYKGQPGYSKKLDRDGDGVACEK